MYIFIQSGEFNSMLSMFDTNGCCHGFSSNWDQRRCRQQHPLAKCGFPLTQEPAQAVMQRAPGFLQCGGCLLHITAYQRCPRSSRLLALFIEPKLERTAFLVSVNFVLDLKYMIEYVCAAIILEHNGCYHFET